MTPEELWLHNIGQVVDNHLYADLYISTVLEHMIENPLPPEERMPYLSEKLRSYYYDCITFILRETPSNAVGNMLVERMCLGIPTEVFDSLAERYLADTH